MVTASSDYTYVSTCDPQIIFIIPLRPVREDYLNDVREY